MKTWHDYVGNQIKQLINFFDLNSQEDLILGSYDYIANESLRLPLGMDFERISKINNNGVPFQYSVSTGGKNEGLRFIGEVGLEKRTILERKEYSVKRLNNIMQALGMNSVKKDIFSIIDFMIPSDNKEFASNGSGAIWIGYCFQKEKKPLIKVYTTLKWGTSKFSQKHFFKIAKRHGFSEEYAKKLNAVLKLKKSSWSPLGAAITFGDKGLLETTLYARYYDDIPQNYVGLFEDLNLDFNSSLIKNYMGILLESDQNLIPGSIVFSFGMSKFEISMKMDACTHCFFSSDLDSYKKSIQLFKASKISDIFYKKTIHELSNGQLSNTEQHYHCFLGLGFSNSLKTRINIYLKPHYSRE